MPSLWSPEDLAARFAPYIEELHDVFAMHGLHYGSPADIRNLAARLEAPGALHEEVASLVRSMVLREGGSVPRTDLLEILATAISGPRMDPAGEELQQPVRQLLAFLNTTLRRPWNEPAGEERLHPQAEDARAQAARELRQAAAAIEAEAQGTTRTPVHPELAGDQIAAGPRANVIPFGRARAVFSRLAREDPEESLEEIADQVAGHPRIPRAEAVAQESEEPASITPVAAGPMREFEPSAHVDALSQLSAGAHLPVRAAAAPATAALPEFDDEPPLPAATRLNRVALFSAVAAAVLIAGVLGLASRGWRVSRIVSAGTSGATALPSQSVAAPASMSTVPVSAATQKPSPGLTPSGARLHFDDGYVAAPYSNMPAQAATATAVASTQTGSATSAAPSISRLPTEANALSIPGESAAEVQPLRPNAGAELLVHPRVPAAVMAMNVIAAPRPDYPMLAKLAHIDGPVVIHAEIARSGAVVDTEVISGHHLLRHAAEDAVRHWRYHPYQVDGKPVPVSTTITVRFRH